MFIRVLVEEEKELLFNTDCQVALLLDAIKRAHNIPRTELIDLCNKDGIVKELWKHTKDNAMSFFKLRELCLVVGIQNAHQEVPSFIPYLKDYVENKGIEVTLNANKEEKVVKSRYKGASSSLPRTPAAGARTVSGKKKRRYTQNH